MTSAISVPVSGSGVVEQRARRGCSSLLCSAAYPHRHELAADTPIVASRSRCTGPQIARDLGMALSTILARRSRGQTAQHGWEFVHPAIDDCTRLAYAEVLSDSEPRHEPRSCAALRPFYRRHGVEIKQLLTHNGSAYVSVTHAPLPPCGIRRILTRPCRPETNGKAERFIGTTLDAGPTARSAPPTSNGIRRTRPPTRPETNGKAERFIGTMLDAGPTARYPTSNEHTTSHHRWP